MKLTPDNLLRHCQQSLLPIYLITGDEPYLRDQAIKTLVKAASREQETEKQIFYPNNQADWAQVWQSLHHQSLFGDKQCIVIHSNPKAASKPIQQQWQDYTQQINTDALVILTLPKLKASQLNAAWIKDIEKVGAIITLWPVQRNQLPQWIEKRVQQYGMRIQRDACQFLSDQVEGELATAAQEVEKLYCLYGLPAKAKAETVELTLAHLRNDVVSTARFDVYDLIDAMLLADHERAIRISQTLQEQGAELTLINWAINRTLRQLCALHQAAPADFDKVCMAQGIWKTQQNHFHQALKRLSENECYTLLQGCQKLDETIKGLHPTSSWQQAESLVLGLCSQRIATGEDRDDNNA